MHAPMAIMIPSTMASSCMMSSIDAVLGLSGPGMDYLCQSKALIGQLQAQTLCRFPHTTSVAK